MSHPLLYRHIVTGTLYEKLYDSHLVDEKTPVVVYSRMSDGRVFVRDAERFHERFEVYDAKALEYPA